MSTIPDWWLYVSAAFFLLNIAVFAVLIWVLLKIKQSFDELKPKLDAMSAKVNETANQLQAVAKRVDDVAKNISSTTNEIGGRARGLVGTAEGFAHTASQQLEKFSPLIVGVVTFSRVLSALRGSKANRARAKANAPNKLAKK